MIPNSRGKCDNGYKLCNNKSKSYSTCIINSEKCPVTDIKI